MQHAVNPYLFAYQYKFLENPAAVMKGNYEKTRILYFSHLYEVESDPIWLYRADELYRRKYPYEDTIFVIWKLR